MVVIKHYLLIAYLILAGAFIVGVYRVETLSRRGVEAQKALCTFRDDFLRRAGDTQKLIADIEEGRRTPIPGITVADLNRSLAGQLSTLGALSNLKC